MPLTTCFSRSVFTLPWFILNSINIFGEIGSSSDLLLFFHNDSGCSVIMCHLEIRRMPHFFNSNNINNNSIKPLKWHKIDVNSSFFPRHSTIATFSTAFIRFISWNAINVRNYRKIPPINAKKKTRFFTTHREELVYPANNISVPAQAV